MANGMPRLFNSRASCRQGPSLRRTSSTANSGASTCSHSSDSALLMNGPAVSKPASSRYDSRAIPMRTWSSTIMQRRRAIEFGPTGLVRTRLPGQVIGYRLSIFPSRGGPGAHSTLLIDVPRAQVGQSLFLFLAGHSFEPLVCGALPDRQRLTRVEKGEEQLS